MQKGEKSSRIFGWTTFFSVVVTLALVLSGPIAYAQKPVDLNTASEKELEAIKGVGPATAKKIIAARPYKSVDELSKAGLSAKQVDTVKPFVTVGSASPAPAAPASTGKVAPAAPSKEAPPKAAATVVPAKPAAPPAKAAEKPSKPTMKLAPGQKVNINTATKEELDALPGIGPVKAQAIIDGRPYQKSEDIMKVKGIKQGEFNKIKDIIIVK